MRHIREGALDADRLIRLHIAKNDVIEVFDLKEAE